MRPSYAVRCRECGREFVAHRSDAERCSSTCRANATRRKQRSDLAEARALLLRQTEAIIAGDADALARVQRDAERLFGGAR